jgi:ubiquinone biosynthesis protein UbiJ
LILSNTLHTAAIGGLETAINAALRLDQSTLKKLQTLERHVFHLRCTAPELDLFLIPGVDEVRLCGFYDGDADTTLSGSAQEFAKLVTSSDPASTLINGDLELHGDSQALINLQKILQQLDVDWEAPLSNIFGDVISHQMGKSIRQGFSFGLQALQGFKRHVDEYIVEESDLVPPRWQVEQFFTDIDQLAMRTERLQAQFEKLKQRQSKKR